LDLLEVKHTKAYSNKIYSEHPFKYNLLGISKMLSDYGIENVGVRIDRDKLENLNKLEAPFVVQVEGDFGVVYKIAKSKVYYLWKSQKMVLGIDEFCNSWSGVALFAESSTTSIEPEYSKHFKSDFLKSIEKNVLFLFLGIILFATIYRHQTYQNLGMMLLIGLSLIGMFAGYLLVQKQLHVHSSYSDKICSLFKKSDCNDILDSNASKLLGVIGWSEIGLSYFTSTLILLSFFPNFLFYFLLINICVLPYSFWSVWYQKFKAKQWCPLCLMVQILFWSFFLVGLFFNFMKFPDFNTLDIILAVSIYVVPLIFANLFVSTTGDAQRLKSITYEINCLKTDKDVFDAILRKQAYYPVGKETSHILFGNREAEVVVTILTNPHCSPCASFHEKVDKLLDETEDRICVQFVFTYFKYFQEEMEPSNYFLVGAYYQYLEREAKEIFKEWYSFGKNKKESFFLRYTHQVDRDVIYEELSSHYNWATVYKLGKTPTVLINGYELPESYKIEDLKYFI
jgi:Vitamin K epoxide reductase family/Thioredoxin/Peptidase C39 family